MFGFRLLKEEILFYKNKAERIEKENWELLRENAQLERGKMKLEEANYAYNSKIIVLEKEKNKLQKENELLTKSLNKKFTKDELIEQLAELLLDENRGVEKESLVKQMNLALRINNNQPEPQGAEPQWLTTQQ